MAIMLKISFLDSFHPLNDSGARPVVDAARTRSYSLDGAGYALAV